MHRDIDVDPVEEVGLTSVPPAFADRLEAIDWDTLGEWYTYLLFFPLSATPAVPDARALAAAWDGDRGLFVRDLDSGAMATVWVSAWDDETNAAQALGALAALYGRAAGPPEDAPAADGEPVWLEQLGNRVVAIKNLDPTLAPDVASAALTPATGERARRLRPPLGKRRRPEWPGLRSPRASAMDL
jgi:hypothetical protein